MISSNNKIERWLRRHHEKAIREADRVSEQISEKSQAKRNEA